MKVTMEFDLPEDESSLILAQNGSKYFFALLDFSNKLRAIKKYGQHSEEQDIMLEKLSEGFLEILGNRDVHLDDVE
jgi:hypothetical protein